MVNTQQEILIINKPRGMTSHDVVDAVRKMTGEQRVGHAGTLDPLARGVLIVLVGKAATKRQKEFMSLPKEYEAEITFGSRSKTDDKEGPMTQTATFQQLANLSEDQLRRILPQFVGNIRQRPPEYSAIKVAGTPLYKQARKNKIRPEDIAERSVQIDAIELFSFTPFTPPFPPTARLRIRCQKGVYIRALARDVGEQLGVGAYLSDLVRTRVGPYSLDQAMEIHR